MARSSTVAASPPHPSLTAAPSITFFFLLLISSSSPSPSAMAESDAATSPLQHPTMSVSLSLSVSEEIKANPFDFISLPQQRPEQGLQPHEDPRQPERLQEGASVQGKEEAKGGSAGVVTGGCSYTVVIKTSCSSPRVTRDAVSLAFGDAYHNEVYAARMDDPASGTFERCSVDTFRVVGPCGGRTCYLYLRRSGRDGWTPEYVKVLYRPGDSRSSVTFFYGSPLPNGVWYGFNLCERSAAGGSTITAIPAAVTIAISAIGAMRLGGGGVGDDGSAAATG